MADTASPLTSEQQDELRDATERAGSFLGAVKVAAFNGWTLGFFAVLSILFGFTSPTSLLVGLGLAVIARNEFVGRARIRAWDASGLELLWRNQIGLMALIIAYCLWSMYRSTAFADPEMTQLLELLGEDTGQLIRSLTFTVYVIVIGATVIFQGLNARYYFVRIERLRDHVRSTPEWIRDVQRLAER